ncbi:hypothetical protein OPIT5_14075 [Opitutaceae bacterium TAV5]|nr:hypothetical protein OPIT5_14075 [Opitutaceae bacterium TAV5]
MPAVIMSITRNLLFSVLPCLAVVVTFAGEPSAASGRESPKWLASPHWRPAPAKGVTLETERVTIDGKPALRLRCDFAGGGRYAAAYLRTPVEPAFAELRLTVKTTLAPAQVLVRFQDADGETLQYAVQVSTADEWQDLRIDVSRPTGTFAERQGAVLNRKADFPLRGILLGLQPPKGATAAGDVIFSDVELIR